MLKKQKAKRWLEHMMNKLHPFKKINQFTDQNKICKEIVINEILKKIRKNVNSNFSLLIIFAFIYL